MPVELFFDVSIKLCETLTKIHEARVLHLDLKPSNVLYNEETKEPKIFDFSIGAVTSITAPYIRSQRPMGSYQYMPPEQTGRNLETIDSRSDIYSLGATFYHLLSGELPFQETSAASLIYAHIVTTPKPMDNIPDSLNYIILKCLEKNKQDRYQVIRILQLDLQNAKAAYMSNNKIPFVASTLHISDIFELPSSLYGRERYVNKLETLLTNVRQTKTQLVLLAGEPGVGKTSIYGEFCNRSSINTLFVSGKYDQFNTSVPYSAILTCMQSMVGYLLGNNIDVRDPLLEALDGNGRILIELIPDIQIIIGDDQPSLPSIGGEELQERFLKAMVSLFTVFTTCVKPCLCIMIDDLQWADVNSFKLISRLLNSAHLKFMMIGIYRDNEVDHAHPLNFMLDDVKRVNHAIVHDITVDPLNASEIEELVIGTIYRSGNDVKKFSKLLTERSGGNPFFARQLLLNLYQEQYIVFDYERQNWQFDSDRIHQIQFADNVVNMMISTMNSKCSQTMLEILKTASCIGNYFSFADLQDAVRYSTTELRLLLREAVKDGWLVELSDISFKFNHDKLQESAYKLMDKETLLKTHRHLGTSILKHAQKDCNLDDKLFDIVQHFNKSIELIILVNDRDEINQLIDMNCKAVSVALMSSAATKAVELGEYNMKLLPPHDQEWPADQYDRYYAAHYWYAEALRVSKIRNCSKRVYKTHVQSQKTRTRV